MKRPSSLIKQDRVTPTEQPKQVSAASSDVATNSDKVVETEIKQVSISSSQESKQRKFKNQDATIKLSRSTKEEIELLMKLKDTKFTYEMIETMIDSYVSHELTTDEQRSFRTLKEFIQK